MRDFLLAVKLRGTLTFFLLMEKLGWGCNSKPMVFDFFPTENITILLLINHQLTTSIKPYF